MRHQLGVMHGPCWVDAAPALAGQPCPVDMVAQTPVQLRTVPVAQLRGSLQQWPVAAQGLVQSMAQGYCQQAALAVSRVAQDAVARFAQWLLEHAEMVNGRMTVQLKDMRNATATAEEIGFDAPITGLLEQLYAEGVKNGLGDLDQAGLYVELQRRNALD